MRGDVVGEPAFVLFGLAQVLAVGFVGRHAQISRLDSSPMMWAANGFKVAMPSRTA